MWSGKYEHCECFISTFEEVFVGYFVGINSSIFGEKLRKHSQKPIGDCRAVNGNGTCVISCKGELWMRGLR